MIVLHYNCPSEVKTNEIINLHICVYKQAEMSHTVLQKCVNITFERKIIKMQNTTIWSNADV